MGVTTVAKKSSHGVMIAFPDVCFTPPTAGPVPIPYPSFAKTATAVQQRRKLGGVASMQTASTSLGDEAGVLMETVQLKGRLNQLNLRLQALAPSDPNQWQAVLQEYAVIASALYMTMTRKGG